MGEFGPLARCERPFWSAGRLQMLVHTNSTGFKNSVVCTMKTVDVLVHYGELSNSHRLFFQEKNPMEINPEPHAGSQIRH